MAGFPSGSPNYSRQQYGFGAGGAVIKDKAFLFLSGERTGKMSYRWTSDSGPSTAPSLRSANFRENMLTARWITTSAMT